MEMGEDKAIEFLGKHCITTDPAGDGIIVTPNEEFNPEGIDFVVCGYAQSGAYRVPGAIDVECHDCKTMIILSPSSPVKPPKLCHACAIDRQNGEQAVKE
jgi:hypothetical protein